MASSPGPGHKGRGETLVAASPSMRKRVLDTLSREEIQHMEDSADT
jgi:hypothetical protein